MATTKSARKATRVIARRTAVNQARRSQLRTAIRKVEEAIQGGDKTTAAAALQSAQPVIMRAAQKGVAHKKTASRKDSRLSKQVAKLGQS
jgi:small subunit ribosomal protein S20